ncbi:Uncharacterised protein [Mycobacteroides abscessus subsp. abscessus]|nr:Uncharacterised protein [Mycobacteroides abscessus subsp. abscessus]
MRCHIASRVNSSGSIRTVAAETPAMRSNMATERSSLTVTSSGPSCPETVMKGRPVWK